MENQLYTITSDRAFIYKILSELYYPPKGLIKDLLATLNNKICSICPGFVKYIPEKNLDIDKLEIDYSKLFVGPFKVLCPPYESVYIDNNNLMGESTIAVKKFYEEENLESLDYFGIPDHIAIELEFMYYLIYQEYTSIENNDQEKIKKYKEKQKKFLNNHPGRWISDFTGQIEKNTKNTFYINLSLLTKNFINFDKEYLQ